MITFNYGGKDYGNAVELSHALPLMTSVMVGYYEGAEALCVNAGALCYNTDIGTVDNPNPRGKGIVKACLESGHNTVLEHGSATFLKKVPIFVARQDLRSRIASFDERSLRYCRATDGSLTYYIPQYLQEEYIYSIKDFNQGQMLNIMRKEWIEQHEKAIQLYSKYTDEELNGMWEGLGLNSERVRETVRAILPIGINTVYMDTRNLWSWVHHSKKRLCLRAQEEIRIIREQEIEQLREVYPIIFNEVKRPCSMREGCQESRPCGKIKLYEDTKMDYATAKKFKLIK